MVVLGYHVRLSRVTISGYINCHLGINMAIHRILFALAHPDDESFEMGAVIAHYAKRTDTEVYLLCATNGDLGTLASKYLEQGKSVADIRKKELECASSILGVKQIFTLGYKDSGMMGSTSNDDPLCLWKTAQAEVVQKVSQVLTEVSPQVVVTFGENGSYGHPDHLAIQRATTEAFNGLRLQRSAEDQPKKQDYQPQKLYYSIFPRRTVKLMILLMRLTGRDPHRAGKNHDLDYYAMLSGVGDVNAQIDIRLDHSAWKQAVACHASQGGSNFRFVPDFISRLIIPLHEFTRVFPTSENDVDIENDLFAGV